MAERVEIVYDRGRWRLFNAMRREAAAMMAPLRAAHIDCLAYGSLARGDVSDGSDIDVFIPGQQSPTIVEAALERHGVRPTGREIVQATPGYAAKAYIYTAELRGYSLPLVELRPTEREFYSFAGESLLKYRHVSYLGESVVTQTATQDYAPPLAMLPRHEPPRRMRIPYGDEVGPRVSLADAST